MSDLIRGANSAGYASAALRLLATVAGAAMAHQSHLRVEIDLRRQQGHSLVHIGHS